MKIQQEILPFRAITIKLEKQQEAKAFFDLVDRLGTLAFSTFGEKPPMKFSNEEQQIIKRLSDARHDQGVII